MLGLKRPMGDINAREGGELHYWGLLASSWGLLEASWEHHRASWQPLGGLLGLLESSLGLLGASWRPLGGLLGPLGWPGSGKVALARAGA